MSEAVYTFERYENKYILSESQYNQLMLVVGRRFIPEVYGAQTIFNIYFDTPDFRLIRASLEKPPYKEKLRLRSYGRASADSPVFIELKKKYNGIVYKRREQMSYLQAYDYLAGGIMPANNGQILSEIEWFRQFYKPRAVMAISCEREGFTGLEDASLRLTFDKNILWRTEELSLCREAFGNQLLEEGTRLMELKSAGAIPLWLCRALDRAGVYPVSFSKYGSAYRALLQQGELLEEVFHCA